VLENRVEGGHCHEQPPRVDFRHVRPALRVLLDVHAERAGRPRARRADGLTAQGDDAGLDDGLGQRRERRDPARNVVDAEVGHALERVGQDHAAVPPHALTGDLTSRQILGQRELSGRDSLHGLPDLDPAPGLLGTGDRGPTPGARPAARATEEGPGPTEAGEDAVDRLAVRDPVRLRGREPSASEDVDQGVLVLAQADHGRRGQEDLARKSRPAAGERLDVDVRGWQHEVDGALAHQVGQGPDEAARPGSRQEESPVDIRMPEHEAIVVRAEEDERGIAVAKAAEQILGRRRSRAEDQQPAGCHRGPTPRSLRHRRFPP